MAAITLGSVMSLSASDRHPWRSDAESGHERASDAPDDGVEQALEIVYRGRRNAMEARARRAPVVPAPSAAL